MSSGKKRWRRLAASSVVVALAACAHAPPPSPSPSPSSRTSTVREIPRAEHGAQEGKASWYGREQHGHLTANGEHFDMYALTAAHRTLPMNTRVRVTNLRNGRSVVVRINDRGPYSKGRIIDVSLAAARVLDMIDAGVVPARVEVIR